MTRTRRLGAMWIVGFAVLSSARAAPAQVYGYTDEKGILHLANVLTDARMRLIAEGDPEPAGRVWHYRGHYDEDILKAATLARVDSSLVKAIIAVESGFNRFARSHKGAMGLMQLMPDTCRRYGVTNPYDPWQNIRAGSRHLRELLDEFEELHLSLAAYNAGANPVRRLGKIPPYRETRDYVRKVIAIYRAGSRVSITKGGQLFTLGPDGQTRVEPVPAGRGQGSAPRPASGAGEPTSLGALAASRRTGTAETPASARPSAAAGPRESVVEDTATAGEDVAAAPAPVADAVTDEDVYYRYTDPSGVVYITRRKPTHVVYEVLRR